MVAAYANKFVIEVNDVARLVFVDERARVAQGIPMASVTVAEVVMTHDNLLEFADNLGKIAAKIRKR